MNLHNADTIQFYFCRDVLAMLALWLVSLIQPEISQQLLDGLS